MVYCAHPFLGLGAAVGVCILFVYRRLWYTPAVYLSPYEAVRVHVAPAAYSRDTVRWWYDFIKTCTLLLACLALARPQYSDDASSRSVHGKDIMLVMDVSGSMQLVDDLDNPRSRFDVAQREAISFVKARVNDPIGIVYFASMAVSRCPVTLDKRMLIDHIQTTSLGDIPPDGTKLGVALGNAVHRLRSSTSQSKIVILLTDGEPTEGDIPVEKVLPIAQKYGITVYTIGVGSTKGSYVNHPFFGWQPCHVPLNEEILQTIARETGGAYFRAEKPDDIAQSYRSIDERESSERHAPRAQDVYELFPYIVAAIAMSLLAEAYVRRRCIAL